MREGSGRGRSGGWKDERLKCPPLPGGGGRPSRVGRVNSYHPGRERVWVWVGGPGPGAVRSVSMGENINCIFFASCDGMSLYRVTACHLASASFFKGLEKRARYQ